MNHMPYHFSQLKDFPPTPRTRLRNGKNLLTQANQSELALTNKYRKHLMTAALSQLDKFTTSKAPSFLGKQIYFLATLTPLALESF